MSIPCAPASGVRLPMIGPVWPLERMRLMARSHDRRAPSRWDPFSANVRPNAPDALLVVRTAAGTRLSAAAIRRPLGHFIHSLRETDTIKTFVRLAKREVVSPARLRLERHLAVVRHHRSAWFVAQRRRIPLGSGGVRFAVVELLQTDHKLWRHGGNIVVACPMRGAIAPAHPPLPFGRVERTGQAATLLRANLAPCHQPRAGRHPPGQLPSASGHSRCAGSPPARTVRDFLT